MQSKTTAKTAATAWLTDVRPCTPLLLAIYITDWLRVATGRPSLNRPSNLLDISLFTVRLQQPDNAVNEMNVAYPVVRFILLRPGKQSSSSSICCQCNILLSGFHLILVKMSVSFTLTRKFGGTASIALFWQNYSYNIYINDKKIRSAKHTMHVSIRNWNILVLNWSTWTILSDERQTDRETRRPT